MDNQTHSLSSTTLPLSSKQTIRYESILKELTLPEIYLHASESLIKEVGHLIDSFAKIQSLLADDQKTLGSSTEQLHKIASIQNDRLKISKSDRLILTSPLLTAYKAALDNYSAFKSNYSTAKVEEANINFDFERHSHEMMSQKQEFGRLLVLVELSVSYASLICFEPHVIAFRLCLIEQDLFCKVTSEDLVS